MSDTPEGPGWWMAADGRWYPPEHAPHGRLGGALTPERFSPPPPEGPPSHPAAVSAGAGPHGPSSEEGQTGRQSRNGLRLLVAALGLTLVALLIALAVTLRKETEGKNNDSTTTTTTSPASQTSVAADVPVDPAVAFAAIAAEDGAVAAVDTIDVRGSLTGLAALQEENSGGDSGVEGGTVRTWTLNEGSWTRGDSISTTFPVDRWILADLTGDGVEDVMLQMLTGNGYAAAVLTAHTGKWTLPSFRQGSPEPSSFVDGGLQLSGSSLTSQFNSCDPNCADAVPVPIQWTYNETDDAFIGTSP